MSTLPQDSLRLSEEDQILAREFAEQLEGGSPSFTANGGMRVPQELNAVFATVLKAICDGRAISISTMPPRITTTTAASLLGVSRPTVMKYIRNGRLSATMVGSHHRLDTKEVLRLLEEKKEEQRQAVFDLMYLEQGSSEQA